MVGPRSVRKLRRALRRTSVVPKKSTEPLSALDSTDTQPHAFFGFDQLVRETLVIALAMIVLGVFPRGAPQVCFADRDDLAETFRLDRANKAFGVGGACMAVPACAGATTWGITDARTWLDSFGLTVDLAPHRPLLFDEALNPKPAYFAVRSAIAERAPSD